MENRKDQACVQDAEAEKYREKIIELSQKIQSKRFLKAIYISISDYLKEIEPD